MRFVLWMIFFFLLPFPGFALSLNCQTHACMAVIDAGSTKSYLHLYQYDLDESHKPIHVEEKWSQKVTPGLANLEVEEVPIYFDKLFHSLHQAGLPVYLYATAGMRLLPTPRQEKLYQAVRRWFVENATFELKEAKTITGTEEGIYAFVSANYKLGRLSTQGEPPVGVMDMGGASVQVVFPVSVQQDIAAGDLKTITVQGQSITLFVHSFLGLGQTEVVHQLMDVPGCYASGYLLPNQTLATGDVKACIQKVDLLLQVHDVSQVVQPILMKNPVKHWFVMGGLSAFAKNFLFHFDNAILQPQTLIDEGVPAYCETSWDQLYPHDAYMPVSCLNSVYFYELLVAGYGLSPTQSVQFSADDTADDWTSGVVLLQ